MGLKVRTARNSMIMGGVQLAMRPINLIISVVLARLLDPGDFGLVTLTLVLIQSSNVFSSLGMGPAIVHSDEDRGKVAYHAFVIVMTLGILLYGLILFFAQPLAQVLGDPRTEVMLRWLGAWIVLNALSLIPLSLLRKDLHFEKMATASLLSELCYAVLVIGMAYLGLGVWSLVYANLIFTAITTVLYWLWCPGAWEWIKPKPWDWGLMRRLLDYGVPVSVSGLLAYLHTNVDDWLVGRIMGVSQLGLYSKAFDFSNTTIGKLARSTIGVVFFPSYAKIREDKERLERAYLKTVRLVFLMVTPMAMGCYAVASPLVQVAFGDKWMPMVPTLQIFGLLILTRPISENTSPLFQAVGLPHYNTRAAIVLLAFMLPLFFLFLPWGIAGAALAVSLSHVAGVAYNIYQVNTFMPGSAKHTVQVAWPILVLGLVMLLCVELALTPIANFWGTVNSLPTLFSAIGVGVLVYGVGLLITQGALMRELWQVLIATLPGRFKGDKPVRVGKRRALAQAESTDVSAPVVK